MNTERYKIYLAALLHDIGKFYQRADEFFNDSERTKESQSLIQYICPPNEHGGWGYQHVVWTYQFFLDNQTLFNSIENGVLKVHPFDFSRKNEEDDIVNLAIYHHNPSSAKQAIIQLADHWSSGIDRDNDKELTDADKKQYGKYLFKKVPLRPISQFIEIGSGKDQRDALSPEYGYKLMAIDCNSEDNFHFKVESEDREDKQINYATLWKGFENEFRQIGTDTLESFTYSLFYLLKKYTSFIPASTNDNRNVSLFEHLKTTASIAVCIYQYYEKYPEQFELHLEQRSILKLKDSSTETMLMFCADVSGIQKFIYDVPTRQASVSMKGRSFYLQLMIDSLVKRVADVAQVPVHNVIYSSGGKFYMLLPNLPEVVEKLKQLREEIINEIFDAHQTSIYVCMDWIPFSYASNNFRTTEKDLAGGNIPQGLGNLWKALADKTSSHKTKKYSKLLMDNFEDFFGQNERGIEEILHSKAYKDQEKVFCAVTGELLLKSKAEKLDWREQENDRYVSPSVYAQIALGKALKDADYHVMVAKEDSLKKLSKKSIPVLGYYHWLGNEANLPVSSQDTAMIRKINNLDFFDAIKGNKNGLGFLFYGGNKQASTKEGAIKLFDALSEIEDKDNQRMKKLAILMLDVDGLGTIFQKGMNKVQSFASYATFSAQLDFFFSGYVNNLRNQDKYKDYINILYSGGDDLCAVGRWDLLIEFGIEVRKKFSLFFCEREDLTFSAGVALVPPKYPIAKAIELAKDAEKKAKEHDKNALCLFGETISWKEEIDFVIKLRDILRQAGLPKSICQKLMTFHQMKVEASNTNGRKSLDKHQWRWISAYYFAKCIKETKEEDKEKKAILDAFKIALMTGSWSYEEYTFKRTSDDLVRLLSVSARWAELLNRTHS